MITRVTVQNMGAFVIERAGISWNNFAGYRESYHHVSNFAVTESREIDLSENITARNPADRITEYDDCTLDVRIGFAFKHAHAQPFRIGAEGSRVKYIVRGTIFEPWIEGPIVE